MPDYRSQRGISSWSYRLWWGLLILAVAAGLTGLILGAISIGRQDNGFSTPSLSVNRLRVGETSPLFKRKRSEEGVNSLTVTGSTEIHGDLILSEGGTVKSANAVGTTLIMTKTVNGTFTVTKTYGWTVSKSGLVPNATIPSNQCSVVGYNVEANRHLLSETCEYGMTGTIEVTNGGEADTKNLIITDSLEENCGGGTGFYTVFGPVAVDISAKPVLGSGETFFYSYNISLGSFVPNPTCSYRNSAKATITNHARLNSNNPNNKCDGTTRCGPQFRVGFEFPSNKTVIEIHESAKITDFADCPIGFTCLDMPQGDVAIPTEGVCEFDFDMAECRIFRQICNVLAECDTYHKVKDFIRLMSVNETTALVTDSNTVPIDIYSGECQGSGCTLTIGYWRNHNGFVGKNADRVTPLLPIDLGCPPTKGASVTTALQSTSILQFNGLEGGASNGLNRLAAQLLAAKLNLANGATNTIDSTITDADGFLCSYGFAPGSWDSLSRPVRNSINDAMRKLDRYNNGLEGTPHCS